VPAAEAPVSAAEAAVLFADLHDAPALILAVSGGPDSTALLWLAARWRDGLEHPPRLIAVTIDHGLRPESAREALAVKRLAKTLGVEHRTLKWIGKKPKTGIQEAARNARYRLLSDVGRKARARHILTAHTRDDQAETVLFRLARGSGISGLKAMTRSASLPGNPAHDARLVVRPLLAIPKSRLLATLAAARVPFADDPSNSDPRFTRPRLRQLMPGLAAEGLDARRLALLASRMARADQAIEHAVDAAIARLREGARTGTRRVIFAPGLADLPAEVALRALGRAIAETGEGPVELAKLEALHAALGQNAPARFRRTLAGTLITLANGRVTVERAPPRRSASKTGKSGAGRVFTTLR
jgi:tRNA(Ile)-lysidine synthase